MNHKNCTHPTEQEEELIFPEWQHLKWLEKKQTSGSIF